MSESNKSSPWVWLSLVAVVALFTTFIVYLDQKIVKSGQTNSPVTQSGPGTSEPVIDFYSVLPNREIEVQVPESKPVEKPLRPTPNKAKDDLFMLQVGSFRKAQDAERRKAELALLGLEARVMQARVSGEAYHRVELGPFSDDGFFSQVKNRLIKNDIHFLRKSVN